MAYFGIRNYDSERNVEMRKTRCFYSNLMYFKVAKRSWADSEN